MNKEIREQPPSKKIEVIKQTPQGDWLKRETRDQQGRVIRKEEREFIDPKNPEKGVKWEKTVFYDESGNLKKERGRNNEGTVWEKDFTGEGNYGDFPTREHGRLIEGPDKGHEWQITFQRDEKGRVLVEEGEILEQGINPEKPEKGHAWKVKHFYDKKGNWRGKIGIITGGKEKGRVYIQGNVLKEEVQEFLAQEEK